ncbi:putative Kazal domain superfamily protein [Helianthus annuus]|nr:putative Kazal domain superfamily protein [Helianthus annuus]KAJ0553637.1 putative Kazal domain superfamily protein [Helianthus annuus]KAJ0897999.1 putative Kazal domain superfamily protein [Helianthus annuus]KAJ0901745.1 putative Kazal domain superfamily protein [Helianthus annuus]
MSRKPSTSHFLLLLIIIIITVAVSAARTSAQSTSLCPSSSVNPEFCPINCFRPDPVCGADNVTYTCGCDDALCAGVRVVKLGPCDA